MDPAQDQVTPSRTDPPHSAASPASCANCATILTGRYCAECGQSSVSPLTSVRDFLADVLHGIANVDSRLLRSLGALLFKPGHLTESYLEGRRVRYTQPVTIYLLCSAAFFFVASFRPFLWVDVERQQVIAALPGLIIGSDVAEAKLGELVATGVSLELFAERFGDAVNGFLPAFLIGSILIFSLMVHALHFRRKRPYLPHALFALHWTAFYLLIIGGARLLPGDWIMQVVTLVLGILYLSVALRKVYGQSIFISIPKSVILLLGFLLILAAWVQAAIAVGLVVT